MNERQRDFYRRETMRDVYQTKPKPIDNRLIIGVGLLVTSLLTAFYFIYRSN